MALNNQIQQEQQQEQQNPNQRQEQGQQVELNNPVGQREQANSGGADPQGQKEVNPSQQQDSPRPGEQAPADPTRRPGDSELI